MCGLWIRATTYGHISCVFVVRSTAQVNTTSYLEKSATVNLSIFKFKACFNKNIKKNKFKPIYIVNFII